MNEKQIKKEDLSPELLKLVRKAQNDEETGAALYGFMAKREKKPENKKLLTTMASDEKGHAMLWKSYTGENRRPNYIEILLMKICTILLGFTFMVKMMQKNEGLGLKQYELMKAKLPDAARLLSDERRHEKELYNMLDEERLHYVGSMVLGLNDALVELTGAIAGVTFALQNTKLVALTAIITGVSATLSMAASNYLAEKADGNPNALKSSVYTGVAYLVTVALLVLPYLLLPTVMYATAFVIMLVVVILIIMFFNYYISVAKEQKFLKHFLGMAGISLSVAVISFVIGVLAKNLLGISTV